jgi:hypothetical protein
MFIMCGMINKNADVCFSVGAGQILLAYCIAEFSLLVHYAYPSCSIAVMLTL